MAFQRRNRNPCEACKRKRTGCHRESPNKPCFLCSVRNIECITISRRNKSTITSTDKNSAQESSSSIHRGTDSQILEVSAGGPSVPTESDDEEKESHVVPNLSEVGLDTTGKSKTVFLGFSGDQNPWLLREHQHESSILIPRKGSSAQLQDVSPNENLPIFFSRFPSHYLDSRPGEYKSDAVRKIVQPYGDALLRTYFSIIHSTFPLFSVKRFDALYQSQNITATLLAAIYVSAIPFESSTSTLSRQTNNFFVLRDFLAKALPLESRAGTLQTLQSMLLYLQIEPEIIREPNFPGHWMLTASSVALSQELGLNLDPTNWSIPSWEKKERRKLWWLVYVQDKWESLGLSRPSHIHDSQFEVSMLTLEDFEEDEPFLKDPGITRHAAGRYIIALCELSVVLSDVLSLYSVKAIMARRPRTLDISKELLARVEDLVLCNFSDGYGIGICSASFVVAVAAVRLSICSAVLYHDSVYNTYFSISEEAFSAALEVIRYLRDMSISSINGPWWSYSRVNFAIVGSVIISFYLSSKALKDDSKDWLNVLTEYHNLLKTFSKLHQVTRLAALRFENLLSIVTGTENSEDRAININRPQEFFNQIELQHHRANGINVDINRVNEQLSSHSDSHVRTNEEALRGDDFGLFFDWLSQVNINTTDL